VVSAPLDSIVLWDHASAPLSVLERHMLYVSDNHYAEQILRTLGVDAQASPDDAGGLAAEAHLLAMRGVPTPGMHVVDGSGLARADRIAAVTLASLLAVAEARGGADSLYMLMPQGGREGTLRHYDFTTALGRVRAKTGHMTGVSALAGYVNTMHHGRVAFAFMINGSPGDPDSAIVRAVDRIAAL
jgi:D-alanyl-D-alanine carboxypeptidase/D-alanyl-D-alanine-endopeptidase (penicillin-binding protein 4)